MKRILAMASLLPILLTQVPAADFNVSTPGEFQTALTTAQANGADDTINVAAGTYNLAATLTYGTAENFALTIVGAGAATTILDGGGVRQCLNLANEGSGGISVSGLTVRNGRAATLGGGLAVNSNSGEITLLNCEIRNNVSDRSAGGAYLGGRNGTITVDGCVVDSNTLDADTGDDGGGLDIYIDTGGTGSISLLNSIITNNTIGECPGAVGSPDGAGVFMYHLGSGGTITVRNNLIADNAALRGPAGFYLRASVSTTVVFDRNTVRGNESGRPGFGVSGGGIHLHLETATMTFTNNLVVDNQAIGPYANGGGLDLSINAGGTCDILNNVFAGNTAQQHGGGILVLLAANISRAVLAGNLVVSNQAGVVDGAGGGLMLNAECPVTMANNTFFGNAAADAGGVGYYSEGAAGRTLAIANDIHRANTPNALTDMGTGTVVATYSNLAGGAGEPWFGAGCIDADPLFFDAGNPAGADGIYATTDDGLHLTAVSPSANTGSNAAVPAALVLDLAGQARIQGAAVDMGAYEGSATVPVPHLLTMACDPVAGGTTLPAAGVHSLTSPQGIQAISAGGYYFDQWSAEPVGVVIASATSVETTVGFAEDCTVTAHFLEIQPTATLAMAVSPAEGGAVVPVAGVHPDQPTETPVAIVAVPAEGYGFVNWTATRHLTIADADAMTTTVTMVADGTVTANFARLPHRFTVAPGSVFVYEAEHVGEDIDGNPFGDAAFARKPKVFGTYYDPVKDPGREKRKKASVKMAFDRTAPATAVGTWTKKVSLLDKRAILPGQDAETYLPVVQQDELFMEDVWVAVANAAGNAGPFDGGELTLVPPTIAGVYPDDTYAVGTEIDTASAGDIIYLQGNWFGVKPPKVWLEHVVAKASGDVVKAKACKVQKPLPFRDGKGNAGRSCMDLDDADGQSRVAVQLPASWPNGWDHGEAHNLVIDNGIGRATRAFGTAP